jgi:hypothetical protein
MDKLRTGARTPFFCTDITFYVDLTASAFSPIEDVPVAFTDSEEEVYIKSGFLACNATDTAGLLYVITWNEYQVWRTQSNRALVTNEQVLAMCNSIPLYLPSGEWTGTPLVKIFDAIEEPEFLPRVGIPGGWPVIFPIVYVNIGTIR